MLNVDKIARVKGKTRDKIPSGLLALTLLILLTACTPQNPCMGAVEADAPPPNLTYRMAPPDGRPTVLVIGDSFAYGFGVGENETLPAFLQLRLDEAGYDYQVINLGVWGYNTPLILQRLRTTLQDYPNTRLVIYEYYHNDFLPCYTGVSCSQYHSLGKSIYRLVHYFNKEKRGRIEWFRERFVEASYLRWGNGDDIRPALLDCNVREPLLETDSLLKDENITLIIFLLPFQGDEEAEQLIMALTEQSDRTIFLPVREALEEGTTRGEHFKEYRLGDGHPNPDGHRLIAGELFEQLDEVGLLTES